MTTRAISVGPYTTDSPIQYIDYYTVYIERYNVHIVFICYKRTLIISSDLSIYTIENVEYWNNAFDFAVTGFKELINRDNGIVEILRMAKRTEHNGKFKFVNVFEDCCYTMRFCSIPLDTRALWHCATLGSPMCSGLKDILYYTHGIVSEQLNTDICGCILQRIIQLWLVDLESIPSAELARKCFRREQVTLD